jgi:hypothetical protein
MEIETIAKKYNRPIEEFIRRLDGRIEWICEHGIGHTVCFPEGSDNVHGCDRCCNKLRR